MNTDPDNYEKAKQEAEVTLKIEIPNGIVIPEPLPKNQSEWWLFIQRLGSAQFYARHDFYHFRPGAEVSGIEYATKQVSFWGGFVAKHLKLVPPKDCPPGNTNARAGESPSPFVRAFIKADNGVEIPEVIPYPPPGKMWWWDWYYIFACLESEIDSLHRKMDDEWFEAGKPIGVRELEEKEAKAMAAHVEKRNPELMQKLAEIKATYPRVKLVECGSCGAYHRENFDGDCRDDSERFYGWEDAETRLGMIAEVVSTVEEQLAEEEKVS